MTDEMSTWKWIDVQSGSKKSSEININSKRWAVQKE